MERLSMTCLFCESSSLQLIFSGAHHPYAKWHGPFDFYRCTACGSGQTFPIPSIESLSRLYSEFAGGMIPAIRELRNEFPLSTWFIQNISRAIQRHVPIYRKEDVFTFMDIGAGSGELLRAMADLYQNANGLGVDFHDTPESLIKMVNIKWEKTDLNHDDLPEFESDLIFLITVFEHLLFPDKVIRNALIRLKKKGCFYLTTPRLDCLAFRVLKQKWPYYIPGEHLYIPSLSGMEKLLLRICSDLFPSDSYSIHVGPVSIPYPAGYYAKYFGLKKMARLIPRSWLVRMPTGLLEASVTLKS